MTDPNPNLDPKPEATETPEAPNPETPGKPDLETTVYRTQEDFDKAFAKRLEKERKKLADEVKREAEEAASKAKMDDAQRAKAEKEEAEKVATDRVKAADARIIRSEAKLLALSEGANPKRVDAILKLTDLSEVEMGDDGEPDAETLAAAVKVTLEAYPEFKASGSTVGGGTNPAGGGTANAPDKNPFEKENRNLTEQARLMRENPALAKKLQEAALAKK